MFMKKLILTLLATLSLSIGFSQIEKGTFMTGASSSLSYNNYSFKGTTTNLNIFNLNFKGGYFVADNFALGLNINYINLNQSTTNSTTSLGIFVRYYFHTPVFVGVGVSSVTNSFTGFGSSNSSTSTVLPFELGYAAFITRNFAIEPSINYNVGDDKGGVTFNGLNVGANGSFGFNIGFTLYLNRGEETK